MSRKLTKQTILEDLHVTRIRHVFEFCSSLLLEYGR